MTDRICSIDECDKPVMARSWCPNHYQTWYRTGSPIPTRWRPLEQRFWEKVQRAEGCWLWMGGKFAAGYGRIGAGGRSLKAHRVAYELLVGAIPDGLQIDHKCRNKLCVNPDHLQAVTQQKNQENRVAEARNKTGIRGVTWNSPNGYWAVHVKANGKRYWGGAYSDIAEAEAAAIALRNRVMTNNLSDKRASTEGRAEPFHYQSGSSPGT